MADVGSNTVNRFEAGQDARLSSIDKMRIALENAGVIFVAENGEGPGVRLRKARPVSSEAEQVASADDARSQAADAADAMMSDMGGSAGEKADRRGTLTDEPAMVAKAKGRKKS
ncbi:hypothetical protein [Bosea sp. TAF32]|uniref:hypothetical protein n=1 Tax=Bosea sp. TAF32 TaxID=3237482 RepID=UPI003F9268F6